MIIQKLSDGTYRRKPMEDAVPVLNRNRTVARINQSRQGLKDVRDAFRNSENEKKAVTILDKYNTFPLADGIQKGKYQETVNLIQKFVSKIGPDLSSLISALPQNQASSAKKGIKYFIDVLKSVQKEIAAEINRKK